MPSDCHTDYDAARSCAADAAVVTVADSTTSSTAGAVDSTSAPGIGVCPGAASRAATTTATAELVGCYRSSRSGGTAASRSTGPASAEHLERVEAAVAAVAASVLCSRSSGRNTTTTTTTTWSVGSDRRRTGSFPRGGGIIASLASQTSVKTASPSQTN